MRVWTRVREYLIRSANSLRSEAKGHEYGCAQGACMHGVHSLGRAHSCMRMHATCKQVHTALCAYLYVYRQRAMAMDGGHVVCACMLSLGLQLEGAGRAVGVGVRRARERTKRSYDS